MKRRTAGDGSFRRLTMTSSQRAGKLASGRYAMLGVLMFSTGAGSGESPIPAATSVCNHAAYMIGSRASLRASKCSTKLTCLLTGHRVLLNVRFAPTAVIPERCAFHPKPTSDERSAKFANDPVADMLNERLPPKTGRSLQCGQVIQSGPHQPVDAPVKTPHLAPKPPLKSAPPPPPPPHPPSPSYL